MLIYWRHNDDNVLSYKIALALFATRIFYNVYRELTTGKGFVDMMYPQRKKFPEKPTFVVELKWDKSATGAIDQIKNKQYCKSLGNTNGICCWWELTTIRDTREHTYVIEDYLSFE